jgi:hypothetical protein
MEYAFGADFSGVRVHTDPAAAASARSIGALAFTSGSDVVFDSGRYAPGTSEGRRLLAHELAHVAQQRENPSPPSVQRYCDPTTHSCPPGTEAPWSSAPQSVLSSVAPATPATGGTEASVTALVNIGDPLGGYSALRQAVTAQQWAGLNRAAQDRMDRQYARRGTPAEPASGSAAPLTEVTLPARTLLRPEEPAADENFSSRVFQALTTGGGGVTAAGQITRDRIVKLWYQASPSALQSNVRIALIDPQGETGLPPGLTFQLEGHPIATADGGLYLSPVDQATSHYLPGIMDQVNTDLERIGRAADLHQRARALIDFGRTITGRSPTAVASEDFRQLLGVLNDMKQRIQSFTGDNAAAASLLGGISAELTTFISGAQAFSARIESARQAGMPGASVGETMLGQATENLEAQRRAMQRPANEHWWEAFFRYQAAGEYGYAATMGSTGYATANLLTGNQLEVSRELHQAFRGGRISLDDFQQGVSQAHTLGAIVGSINAVLLIATIGLAGPILGTAPSAGAVILYGGTSAAISTAVPMTVSSIYTANTPLQGPQAQQIWMQGGYHTPGEIAGSTLLSFGIGAGLSSIGPLFNWFSSSGNAQMARALAVASAEGRPLATLPNVQSRVVSPGVVEISVTGQPGVIRVTQSGWQVVMQSGAGARTVIMEEAWTQLHPSVAGRIESQYPALSGIQGTATMQPQGGIPVRFGVTQQGYFAIAPQAQNPWTLGAWGAPQGGGASPLVTLGGGPGALGGRASPLLLPGGSAAPPQLYSGEVFIDLQGGDTRYVTGLVRQSPGARGITVESGAWIPGYQGISPVVSPLTGGPEGAAQDLSMLLQLARNSPRWGAGTPVFELGGGLPPALTPEQIDPAGRLFAQPPGVTLVTEPFFPAQGSGGRLIPISVGGRSAQMDVSGLLTSAHPELAGQGTQIYLRRPFALQAASPAQAEAMGQEINRMLRPGGFTELRLLRSGDRQVARTIATQIPGSEIVEVDQRAMRTFIDSGYSAVPADSRQAEILRAAEADIRAGGLGGGNFNSIIRIYKPALVAGGNPVGGQ